MDKIILGLLMLKPFTIYELRNIIRLNLQGMCSDSMGSIQAALKKLMTSGMVTVEEVAESSVNKKVYHITHVGYEYFNEWVCTPMSTSRMKNMELSKLYFMGLAPKEERIALIDAALAEMKEELTYLKVIQSTIGNFDGQVQAIAKEVETDTKRTALLKNNAKNADIESIVRDIGTYNQLTLKLGIDVSIFQITWFEKLKERLLNEEDLLGEW